MTRRILFWTMAFAACLAAAVVSWRPIHTERAALQSETSVWSKVLEDNTQALEASRAELQELTTQRLAASARLRNFVQALSPEQRRALSVFRAQVRLQEQGDTTGAGALLAAAPLQNSLLNADVRPFLPQLLGDPAYARAATTLTQLEVGKKYAQLFFQLGLSAADQEKLEDLLLQREMVRLDADGPPQAGADPALQASGKTESRVEITREIRTKFGAQVAQQLRTYDTIAVFYEATDELETRLSYTATPLGDGQADQLVEMISHDLGRVGSQYWSVPDSVIDRSGSVLSPPQIAALRELQAEQLMRIQTRNNRANSAL